MSFLSFLSARSRNLTPFGVFVGAECWEKSSTGKAQAVNKGMTFIFIILSKYSRMDSRSLK